MRAIALAFTLALAGAVQAGAAQTMALPGTLVTPMGWAANGSSYATAAGEIDTRFLNRTQSPPAFTPGTLSSEIGKNLESRLDASLEQQLQQTAREDDMQVSAN